MSENIEPTPAPEESSSASESTSTPAGSSSVSEPAASATATEQPESSKRDNKKFLWLGVAAALILAVVGYFAVFTIANAPTPTGNIGVKFYDAEPTAATIAADRIKWQEAFDANLSDTFTASDYGTAWLAASVQTADPTAPGAGVDEDPTQYDTTETATFPADITGVGVGADGTPGTPDDNTSAQSAAMTGWATMPAPTGGSTVTEFFTKLKDLLDDEGRVVLGAAYNPAAPVAAVAGATAPELAGTDSEAAAVAEYNKALAEFNNLRDALDAAGYDNVTWNASNAPTYGAVNTGSQDFAEFVLAYDALTAKGAYPFGLVPPTYDVIYNVVGTNGVNAAEAVANTAVGVSGTAGGNTGGVLADGDELTATTNADGNVYYAVFGRTVTEVDTTMDRTCGHLGLVVTETTAPDGYDIDNPDPVTVEAAELEDAITTSEWSDTLSSTPTTPDNPEPPCLSPVSDLTEGFS